MNREIIKKLIKIEKLKYEIIKDILPEKSVNRINKFEKEATTVIKDIVLDLMQESCEDDVKKNKKEVKKVKVDFL